MTTTETLSSTDTAILNAVKAGAQRAGQIATATGLNTELLDAPLKRLRRAGLLTFLKGSGPGTGWQPTVIAAMDDAAQDAPVTVQAAEPATAGEPIINHEGSAPNHELSEHTKTELAKHVDSAAKKAVAKRTAKKGKPDVVYVWDNESTWNVRELAAGEDAETLAKELTEMGMPALAGKLSIGAPEGPPVVEEPVVERTPDEIRAAQQEMVQRFDEQFPPQPLPADESPEAALSEVEAQPAVTPLGSVKSTGKAPKKAKPTPPPAEPVADDAAASTEDNAAEGPADYMLFIGSNFYGKEEFIREASELGISRRMPSHRLPAGLVCGQSRVFVAVGGARKAGEGEDAMSTSEVFGYFIPQRVEFIASTDGGDGAQYADIIASVKARPDSRIITTIQGEAARGCGVRKEGGTYIVVDKADSPLHLLAKPATYVGNHFRGVMKLPTDAAQAFSDGGTYATLIDEVCMVPTCDVQGGRKFKCAPDGHIRATRERKRMERGEDPKWLLACGECRRKAMAAKAAERKAAKGDAPVAAKVNPENPQPEGSVLADETNNEDELAQFNGDN